MRRLCGAQWPGNVRQLRNEVMRLAACARQDLIADEEAWEELPGPIPTASEPSVEPARPQSLKAAVEELERKMIADALRSTGGNQQQAARVLGLSRQGLINKMKRYSPGG
jgi:DNA-binding NtrC family response regulator